MTEDQVEPQGSCMVCTRNDPRRGPVCEWCRQRMRRKR